MTTLSKQQIRSISDRTNLGTQIIEDVLTEAVKQNAVQENPNDPLESQDFFDLMQAYRMAPMLHQSEVGARFKDVKNWLRDNLL